MMVQKSNKKVCSRAIPGSPGRREYVCLEDEEEFTLEDHDVLIKIMACAVSKKIFMKIFPSSEEHCPAGNEVSGVVEQVGASVTSFKPGDEVVGLIPANSRHSGCALWSILSEYDLVLKPLSVSHIDAASVIGDALSVYTALYYLANISCSETVVICSAGSGFGILAVQFAQNLGAKVIVTGSTDEELLFLRSMEPPVDCVIDLHNSKSCLSSVCLEETGGLGVDCIVDAGVQVFPRDMGESSDDGRLKPTKNDIISCLAVGGHWVTNERSLQIDPQDSELLSLKCASLHFLFSQAWSLSRSAQGRYLHILKDIMTRLGDGTLRPAIHHTVLLENAAEAFEQLSHETVGKVVVKVMHTAEDLLIDIL